MIFVDFTRDEHVGSLFGGTVDRLRGCRIVRYTKFVRYGLTW